MENRGIDTGRLRHPVERRLLAICILGSILLLVSLVVGGIVGLLQPESTPLAGESDLVHPVYFILAPAGLLALIVFSTGREYGRLRANAVRITPQQFPDVYALWERVARDLGIPQVPDLYTINGNGLLNAYASCVPGFRSFSAVYSDILETCLRNEDWDSLTFILGHEAAHIRLGHVKWWYLVTTFIFNSPFLNFIIALPLSRAKEYSCDKVGYALTQDAECKGLLLLTAGKHLYNNLNTAEHIQETVEQGGLWATLVNFMAGHPILAWRVNAIRKGHNGGVYLRRR